MCRKEETKRTYRIFESCKCVDRRSEVADKLVALIVMSVAVWVRVPLTMIFWDAETRIPKHLDSASVVMIDGDGS